MSDNSCEEDLQTQTAEGDPTRDAAGNVLLFDKETGERVYLHIMHCDAPRAGWGHGEYDPFLDKTAKYTSEAIACAVIEGQRKQAFHLAKMSGARELGDTLEGRVLQGDWGMAESLAAQRIC